jgi:hypothetical protein
LHLIGVPAIEVTASAVSWETSTALSPFSNTTGSSVVTVSAEAAVDAAKNAEATTSINAMPLESDDVSDLCTFDLLFQN